MLALFIAGFVRGGVANSADPELVFAAFYALAGLGFVGILTAGVSLGIRLARD
jgi:hypothetical protein